MAFDANREERRETFAVGLHEGLHFLGRFTLFRSGVPFIRVILGLTCT